jgi:DNA uptake protein ComE-like DNA-binding protein
MQSFRYRTLLSTALLTLFAWSALAADILDANSASANEMATLPHMTMAFANSIVASRPFKNVGELDKLLSSSLVEEAREALYAALFVPISLNNTSNADIQLIPGVGRQMAHEFEEYRPYTSMEQFRREIGKYVDEAEVARLEQYVTLQ